MSEALAMALDDRRVELETIISSRNFTPLVDITDFFRVQLNSVIHVPLPGSKPGSAVVNEGDKNANNGGSGSSSGSGDSSQATAANGAKLKSSKSGRNLIVGGNDSAGVNRSVSAESDDSSSSGPKASGGMQLRAAKAAASDAEIPSVAVTAKSVGQVSVSVCLYHGSAPLAETRSENASLQAEKDRVAGSAMWNMNLSLGVRFCNLPLAARVIFNVTYKDGSPVGWAGCNVFTAQQVLRSGTLILPLWPGKLTPENILRITNLANTHAKTDSVPSLVVSLHSFGKTVVRLDTSSHIMLNRTKTSATALVNEDGSPVIDYLSLKVTPGEYSPAMRERVAAIIRADPLWRIQGDEAALLWKCREYITNAPEALPKFLQAVKWDDAPSVEEAHRLLLLWRPPSPMQALELLQADFADPTVRAYAVSRLEMLGDAELHTFMLQLTQVLKFEPFLDSSLARFLLRRALRRPRLIGHVLFWYLKAEMHIPEVAERFGAILQQYLVNCGDHRTELGHQMFVMAKLEDIARKVKAAEGKSERLALLRAELPRIVFPERFQLPLSPHMVSKGLIVDKCRVMSSKKLPLWLVFEAATEGATPFGAPVPKALAPKTVSVLFKAGDDLRQDQLTLQLLGVMDAFWKAEGLDMRMCPYRCVSTGDELGMIEVVLNSNTLANIVAESIEGGGSGLSRKFRAAMQVYSKDLVYREWLQSQEPAPDMNLVEDNFVRSCAGYCVATYVLGIGDRHNDNLMLTKDGKLFHIDFGHFLGNFKSKFGYKRERAPFVFTPAFAAVMGGEGAPAYKRFESLACASYNVLRRHGHLLITLFYLMMASGLPELTEVRDMAWLQDKLMLTATEEEAAEHFRKQIKVSLNTRATLFNDAVHLFKHA
jgi:Phosphoinositide 3-kinase family, accessory domain (PIK domain)/Phosphatidylinositol 3- and 4-kinase/Phosphoinositide 3-kinase C2